MTLANRVWLEAQISSDDMPRQSATVTGWARPQASKTISAARKMRSGHGLGAGTKITPTSPYFFFPK